MAEPYDVFGACILLKEVFEDDLGHLFRAGIIADEALDRTIWLRVLDGPGLPTQGIIASFEEARAIAEAIRGAQIPAHPLFLDADGVPGLGSDYVPGQPLNRVLSRARDEAFPLQPDNTLLIVEKLALALTAGESISVSGNPLAHGFLHPGLIYLSNDGEALVTGFGVGATLLDAVNDPDAAPGVRAYLSPEALADRMPSQRADVYSLGAILFHLLTGTALPLDPDERAAAFEAAHVAWDGEVLAPDIRKILSRALAPAPADRFASAAEFRTELDRLIYGGAYSPTTFNLALFMDRLFRVEIEDDELTLKNESEIDVRPYIEIEHEEPEVLLVADEPGVDELTSVPEAVPPASGGGKNLLWAVIGGAAVIAVAIGVFWIGRGTGPKQAPPEPTPTAAEVAASRQAQDDRLRELTQAMVAEMMAEREEEIRQELTARQTRIVELQRRLQQSERRATQGAAAAASEAETQKKLMAEIEEQEKAQREQEDALETERREAMNEAAQQASAENVTLGGGAVTTDGSDPAAEDTRDVQVAENPPVIIPPAPTSAPARPTAAPKRAPVEYGDFVKPEEVDTVPVVVKSQSLNWPRNAQRSKGKGVVVVRLTINPSGAVDEVVVLRADHTGWGIPEAAVEAASGYRYKPGTKDGVAITTQAFITWRYDFTRE